MSQNKKIDLDKIVAITGEPGLFKIISSSKSHVIVENIQTGKRTSVSAFARILNLKDISMFTEDGEKPLPELFYILHENSKGEPAISHKADEKQIIETFEKILPNYDKERVYVSNMRKIFNWFNILHQSGNLKVEEEKKESEPVQPMEAEIVKEPVKESRKKDASKKSPEKTKTTKTKTSSKSATPKKTVTVRKTGG